MADRQPEVAELAALDEAISLEEAKRAGYRVRQVFPDIGPLRRELYVKHLSFFRAGGARLDDGTYAFDQRAFIAGNRVGKSEAGSFETTLHLTGAYGEYAPWWDGRKFETPISAWVAGDTGKTVRDIIQEKLLGPPTAFGSGFIPRHLIEHRTMKSGVADAVESVWVRHVEKDHGAHCVSDLTFKSYDQRREAFQGTAKHLIWLDEECPEDVYDECKMRTMIVPGTPYGGMVILTFTPLMGLTPVVLRFMPGGNMVDGEVLEVAA